MKISYKPLWHTLLEKGMSKEDLRIQAKLTTNAIANMGKDQNISMATLLKICETLQCDLSKVVEITGFDCSEGQTSHHEVSMPEQIEQKTIGISLLRLWGHGCWFRTGWFYSGLGKRF